mgnify:FL=1|jgi:hypothetical protein|tara:strand:+ start:188 stop:556 length:369 start_codon:yes stop_codon:yes gene_type:complete
MAKIDDIGEAAIGQHGSSYIIGDGQKVDLDGSTASMYVCAIYVIAAVRFQILSNLNGEVRSISTVTAESERQIKIGAASDSTDIVAGASGTVFPTGMWVYGKWDNVELHEGSCICYLAPRGY